jgi:hypothetical protein
MSSKVQVVSMFLKARRISFFVNSERAVTMKNMSFSCPSSAIKKINIDVMILNS